MLEIKLTFDRINVVGSHFNKYIAVKLLSRIEIELTQREVWESFAVLYRSLLVVLITLMFHCSC